ncbi:uncharacterized protein LOC126088467 [Schistocerca cancellata]|uniref:uncharacterized protein LOC126088467 n=1 Tax=Schistocerca cancellata TaxID=274614 RepID=UPI00211731A2|nr:uncharacterized protein LOC126088467 [Schistocerca cancellata]
MEVSDSTLTTQPKSQEKEPNISVQIEQTPEPVKVLQNEQSPENHKETNPSLASEQDRAQETQEAMENDETSPRVSPPRKYKNRRLAHKGAEQLASPLREKAKQISNKLHEEQHSNPVLSMQAPDPLQAKSNTPCPMSTDHSSHERLKLLANFDSDKVLPDTRNAEKETSKANQHKTWADESDEMNQDEELNETGGTEQTPAPRDQLNTMDTSLPENTCEKGFSSDSTSCDEY